MAYQDLDSIHVPSAGQRPPAAWGTQVNANFDEVYTQLLSKLGVWTSYTPTITQSGLVGNTVTYARYLKIGRLVVVQTYQSAIASGTANNKIQVALPFTAAQSSLVVGSFYIYDASVNINYLGHAALDTTSTVTGLISGTNNYMGATGSGFTAALASGDSILAFVIYESAS